MVGLGLEAAIPDFFAAEGVDLLATDQELVGVGSGMEKRTGNLRAGEVPEVSSSRPFLFLEDCVGFGVVWISS